MTPTTLAAQSGTFDIVDLGPVRRLGFGAMRLTGPGIWGEPADREVARSVARRAVDLGVDFIDTADSYGPNVSEEILAEALYPYPAGVRIATKVGLVRPGPGIWRPVGRPEYLRQQAELSLRKLRTERLDLLQLHRPDPQVPLAEQFGALAELQSEGKVAALGLSNVTVAQIEEAGRYFSVATVQNRYNLTDGSSEDVLDHCTAHGIGFIPWAPISAGALAAQGGTGAAPPPRVGAAPGEVALAWALWRPPAGLPGPGTGSIAHLEENLGAAAVRLDDDTYAEITAAR